MPIYKVHPSGWTFCLPFPFVGISYCNTKTNSNMVSKIEFENAAKRVGNNFMAVLPKMINYKSIIQREVLEIATRQEMKDVRDCRVNQSMIDKLARLANRQWVTYGDAQSLYCAAMAVATIIKEYDWGTYYLVGDGMWEMACRIQNA